MNTPNSEYDLISAEQVFGRVEETLSSYANNGLIDTSQYYSEIRWIISNLGLGAFEMNEAVIFLKEHKAEIPCDFYLLDSAWLCASGEGGGVATDNWQGKYVYYTTKTCETILQDQSCPAPNQTGYSVNACNNEQVLEKVTLTEYVSGAPNTVTWSNPVLMKLNNKKSIGKTCINSCKNLFYSSPYEISIHKRGGNYVLTSNLKEPTIFLKYWRFPLDEETGLPLVPNDPIIEKAIYTHLIYWTLVKLWTNSEDTDIERKIQYWEKQRNDSLYIAKNYAKMPSFLTMVNYANTVRRRWPTYEQINSRHI
jgi:hypothetical protein